MPKLNELLKCFYENDGKQKKQKCFKVETVGDFLRSSHLDFIVNEKPFKIDKNEIHIVSIISDNSSAVIGNADNKLTLDNYYILFEVLNHYFSIAVDSTERHANISIYTSEEERWSKVGRIYKI